MKFSAVASSRWLSCFVWITALATQVSAQVLTIQIGSPPPPDTVLVNHGDQWRYRKGNSEPQGDWKIAVDSDLDGTTWLTGPGGFGYADGDDATVLSDMLGGYNTVYIRKSFDILPPIDATRRVILTMDWDDGFVAYLDGSNVVRSPNVTVANPLFNSATVPGQNHEAFGGGGAAPTSYDLGSAGSLLTPGSHVLAVHGLNSDPASSDFSLIADLRLTGGSQAAGGGELFAIVSTNQIPLSGTNTIPGTTRVTVNGEPAIFNPATGEWSRLHTLAPGLNHLFVAALDGTGALLSSTNRDVVYETASTTVSGVLSGSPVWDGANGTIRISSPVVVPNGVTLRITNGAVVLLSASGSLRATTNGVILATGARNQPVVFAPADGETPWGDIGAYGTNASLTLSFAEVVAGQVRPVNGGMVLIEDSVMRDFTDPRSEFISANSGGGLIMRRTYATRFDEMDASETPVLIEDSLLEGFAVDGLDIKGTNVSLVVRRTTLRKADPENNNADGIDFGPGPGTVENCLIHGFPDKGVSVGGAPGTRISDTLIFDCGIGISAYSSTNLSFVNNTISRCAAGILFRNNPTPAVGVASNMIVWGNTANVIVSNTSALAISYSDIEATNWPGPGNLSADPLFVDSARNNFRLAAGSPAIGSGFGGANMGTSFPVGGLPPPPFNLAALVTGTNAITVAWQEDADNETGFEIERSTNGVDWAWLAGFGPNVTDHVDQTAELNQRYFYRARAFNSAGESRLSNPASAVRQQLQTLVGGMLAGNNIWSPAMGTIVVGSTVVVPAGATLTMLPGTLVQVTNNASIVAAGGGIIDIAGTAENKVQLLSVNAGTLWGQLSAQFTGSLTVRFADVSGGQITVYSNAVGVLEDSYIHDYRRSGGSLFTAPIILTHFAAPVAVRRCHVREYHETLWRNGVITIEDSLFEQVHGDAVDFDAAQPGTAVRRCTFRHGNSGNVDAVDVGPDAPPAGLGASRDVLVEDCVMYDFPFDKGVSCGDAPAPSLGTVVRNCLIYGCLSGVMAKDHSFVTVSNCTIANNNWGFTNYNKNGSTQYAGGHTTNTQNNILWDNGITVSMRDGGTLLADYSDFGSISPVPVGVTFGSSMISVNPIFLDSTNPNLGYRDYRLAANSPCLGRGRDGVDLGARFPVGAPMALSHPRIESFGVTSVTAIVRFWADSEKTYSVLCSDSVNGGTWVKLADVSLNPVPRFLSVTNAIAPNNRFYRLVTPAQP